MSSQNVSGESSKGQGPAPTLSEIVTITNVDPRENGVVFESTVGKKYLADSARFAFARGFTLGQTIEVHYNRDDRNKKIIPVEKLGLVEVLRVELPSFSFPTSEGVTAETLPPVSPDQSEKPAGEAPSGSVEPKRRKGRKPRE